MKVAREKEIFSAEGMEARKKKILNAVFKMLKLIYFQIISIFSTKKKKSMKNEMKRKMFSGNNNSLCHHQLCIK